MMLIAWNAFVVPFAYQCHTMKRLRRSPPSKWMQREGNISGVEQGTRSMVLVSISDTARRITIPLAACTEQDDSGSESEYHVHSFEGVDELQALRAIS